MNNIQRIELFFQKLEEFLIDHNLEDKSKFIGHSEEEIERIEDDLEINYGHKLPFAYKRFLMTFAKGNLSIFDSQNYCIEEISTAIYIANQIIERDQIDIEENSMVFSQWQGYNFTYLLLGDDNPQVKVFVEGDGSVGSGEKYKLGTFTNWLIQLVERNLHLRKEVLNIEIDSLLHQLNEISLLCD